MPDPKDEAPDYEGIVVESLSAEEPEVEEEADAEGEPQAEQPEKAGDPAKYAKDRIKRLKAARDKAREEAAEERRQREAVAQELTELRRQRAADDLDESAFETFDAYEAARERILSGENDAKPKPREDLDGLTEAEFSAARQSVMDRIAERAPELQAKIAEAKVTITARMVRDIADTDHPEAVLAALIADPALAERIARMSETKRVLALDRLDKPAAAPARKTVSGAPEPAQPVGGGAVVTDPGRLPYDEFAAWLDARQAARLKQHGV